MMIEAEKVSETSELQSEVMGGGVVEVARIGNSMFYHYSAYLMQWSHL